MKGTYLLMLKAEKPVEIIVGKLGKIKFDKGNYIYIGSAMNNIEKRVERHKKRDKKKHWHIDYLTTNKNFKVEDVFIKESNKKQECAVAKEFAKRSESIAGFGCSDCKCGSHLFKVE